MKVDIEEAVKDLMKGKVVSMGTDTVYGLAASFEGVDHLFALKKRGSGHPMVVLGADLSQLEVYFGTLPPKARVWMEEYWPGPLTLVLPCKNIPSVVVAGRSNCGFRIPNHPQALALLKKTGPLVVTSANPTSKKPATTPEEVQAYFPEISVVDGGLCCEPPSTVLIFEGEWKVIRRGRRGLPAADMPLQHQLDEQMS